MIERNLQGFGAEPFGIAPDQVEALAFAWLAYAHLLRLPGNLPHIVIITGGRSTLGEPLMVHNIGAGTQVEPIPVFARNVGRFRFAPDRA